MEKISENQLAEVQRIVVLCLGLVGDTFIRVPLVEALRQRFPKAYITVVVEPASAQVLENHPDCDEVVVVSRNKKPLLRFLRTILKTMIQLRKRHYDVCIDLYSGGSSPLLTCLIAARIRIGFDHTKALRFFNNVLIPRQDFCSNWTKSLAVMLEPLEISLDQVRRGSTFFPSHKSQARVGEYLDSRKNYVVFNLGAGAGNKCWPVDRYTHLAKKISNEYGYVPLVFTNPGMEYLAQAFKSDYGEDALILPVLSLDQVGAIMERCRFVVSGDTSLMHMAFGLKIPTLVLFTYTRPELVEPEDCFYQWCFKEGRQDRDVRGNYMGVNDISVDYAFSQFQKLLAQCAVQENSDVMLKREEINV